MLKPSSHQSKKKFMNVVHIVHIGRIIHKFLIYNVIYYNLVLNRITVGRFFMKIDFQENYVMLLLHGALQFIQKYVLSANLLKMISSCLVVQ